MRSVCSVTGPIRSRSSSSDAAVCGPNHSRRIAGGRGRVRKALYAAAFPAAYRWNPHLIALYKRLTESKKTHKQALIACARKLLVMVNAVVARGTPWVNTETAI